MRAHRKQGFLALVESLQTDTRVRRGFGGWLSALGFGSTKPVTLPMGVRVYAVGDIHGCSRLLDQMHERIAADGAGSSVEKRIVYLGDYIDRGPDSKGSIERLLNAVPDGFEPVYLKGNHDGALLDFLVNSETYRAWRNFGAPATLVSYGVRPPLYDSAAAFEVARMALTDAIPREHLEFLRKLELSFVLGDYVFVHAGLRPGIPIDRQQEQDLLWIRDEFLGSGATFEKCVVHGHTPVPNAARLRQRIPVDTGAYATGVLTCAVLEADECRFLQVGRP